GDATFGPADSAVRFVDYWEGGRPDLDALLEVDSRRGCDLDPIDPTSDHGRRTLESCLWPDEHIRFANLRAALDIARAFPVDLDQESADTWIARQLAKPVAGVATVVFHSVFWPYLPDAVQDTIRATIEAAGERATADAPLAWLRYEGDDAHPGVVALRLRVWPGGEERLLGTGRHHWHPVHWLGGRARGPPRRAPVALAGLTRAASDQRDAELRSPTCAGRVQPRDVEAVIAAVVDVS